MVIGEQISINVSRHEYWVFFDLQSNGTHATGLYGFMPQSM